MTAFAGPDSLRIEKTSVEVTHLDIIGTIPGVIPLLSAARNESGVGRLSTSGDGQTMHWRASESNTEGPGVRTTADGSYLLLDGEDEAKWLRVQVDVSEMAKGAVEGLVELFGRYNNPVSSDDITAGEASAGDVATYTLTLENQSNTILSQLTVWIDSNVSGIEIADDGATWVSPITQATGLVLPDLIPAGTDTLHVRRTITAGAVANGEIETLLHFSYRG